jgi:hypothetical protein
MHNCEFIGDCCDVSRVLAVLASYWCRQATCRCQYSSLLACAVGVNAQRSVTSFSDGWRLVFASTRTRDDVPVPPDISAPPTFFLGDLACTLLCCRSLLRFWLMLAYLNWALLYLPVIFTGICFFCPQSHLEFEPRSWAAIHYNPPSSLVSSHVFIPRNLSVLSGGTVISLLILSILIHDYWNLQMRWMYGCAFENVFTTSHDITFTIRHLQGMKQTVYLL